MNCSPRQEGGIGREKAEGKAIIPILPIQWFTCLIKIEFRERGTPNLVIIPFTSSTIIKK